MYSMNEIKPLFSLNEISSHHISSNDLLFGGNVKGNLVLVKKSGELTSWDIKDRKMIKKIRLDPSVFPRSSAASSEHEYLLISGEKFLRIFDMKSGALKKEIPQEPQYPLEPYISDFYCSDNYAAIGTTGMHLKVIDLKNLEAMYNISVARPNSSPYLSGQLNVAIAESLEQVYCTPKFIEGIEIRDLKTGKLVGKLENDEFKGDDQEHLLFEEKIKALISVCGWTVLLWDVKNKKLALKCILPQHDEPWVERKYVHSVAISAKNNLVFIGLNYGYLIAISLDDGSIKKSIQVYKGSVRHICVFDDQDVLVTIDAGNYMQPSAQARIEVWKLSDFL